MHFIAATINGVDMVQLRDRVLTAPVFGGTYGDYPWDRWEAAAKETKLDEDLVNLGRAVFREASSTTGRMSLRLSVAGLMGARECSTRLSRSRMNAQLAGSI